MEQIVLWQPVFTYTDSGTIVTCFLSSASILEPDFENDLVIKEIFQALDIEESFVTISQKSFNSVYTIYPEDYKDIQEGWTNLWLVKIDIQGIIPETKLEDENEFINGGKVPLTSEAPEEYMIIVDFENEIDLQRFSGSVKAMCTLYEKRSIRDQLVQGLFIYNNKKKQDSHLIINELREVFDQVTQNNGFYNFKMRVDELG